MQAIPELCGIKKGQAGVDDLEKYFNKVESKPVLEPNNKSARRSREQNNSCEKFRIRNTTRCLTLFKLNLDTHSALKLSSSNFDASSPQASYGDFGRPGENTTLSLGLLIQS